MFLETLELRKSLEPQRTPRKSAEDAKKIQRDENLNAASAISPCCFRVRVTKQLLSFRGKAEKSAFSRKFRRSRETARLEPVDGWASIPPSFRTSPQETFGLQYASIKIPSAPEGYRLSRHWRGCPTLRGFRRVGTIRRPAPLLTSQGRTSEPCSSSVRPNSWVLAASVPTFRKSRKVGQPVFVLRRQSGKQSWASPPVKLELTTS